MAALLGGCAHLQPSAPPVSGAELVQTPFFPQSAYQCGPAALATVLVDSGAQTSPDRLVEQVWVEGRKGSLQPELLAATRRAGRLPIRIEPDTDALNAAVGAGYPTLVLLNLGVRWLPVWHYAVVIGRADDGWILRSGTTKRRWMPHADFTRAWKLADHWGFIVAHPAHVPDAVTTEQWVRAADDLANTGHADDGVIALEQAVRRWPNDKLAWFALGNARAARGDWPAAQVALERAVSLGPDWTPAVNNLVSTLLELGCPDRAAPLVGQLRASSADYARQTVREFEDYAGTARCQLTP